MLLLSNINQDDKLYFEIKKTKLKNVESFITYKIKCN